MFHKPFSPQKKKSNPAKENPFKPWLIKIFLTFEETHLNFRHQKKVTNSSFDSF